MWFSHLWVCLLPLLPTSSQFTLVPRNGVIRGMSITSNTCAHTARTRIADLSRISYSNQGITSLRSSRQPGTTHTPTRLNNLPLVFQTAWHRTPTHTNKHTRMGAGMHTHTHTISPAHEDTFLCTQASAHTCGRTNTSTRTPLQALRLPGWVLRGGEVGGTHTRRSVTIVCLSSFVTSNLPYCQTGCVRSTSLSLQ